MSRLFRFLAMALLAPGSAIPADAQSDKPPLVLAAASLQESMNAAADAWAAQGHPRPVLSFAASSALARQVEAGAPADLFASADQDWMDELAKHGLLIPGSRANFVRNRLVVIAAPSDATRVTRANLGRVLGGGPLAMADPAAVPAGKYGEAALRRLGAWTAVAPHVVRAENVRAALALVERGAARYGIVYETDARASTKVRIAGLFPATSHAPIVYPIARLKASGATDADGFRRFILSRAGRAIFARYGFSTP